MRMRKLLAVLLCLVLAAGTLSACTEGTGGTETTAAGFETEEAQTNEAGEPVESGEDTTAEAGEDPEAVSFREEAVNLACGDLTGEWNALFARSEGDKTVAALVQPSMLSCTRQGVPVFDGITENTEEFAGKTYTYEGPAAITASYNEDNNSTTYTIRLRDGLNFGDGTSASADDLIFTYYVLCDASYDGPYEVADLPIFGIRAYQLNNTAAPGIEITADDINNALGDPNDDIKAMIRDEIIRPTLEEEKQWCIMNWQKYQEKGYGDSAEELFVLLYTSSISENYSIGDKTFDEILDDTVELFGMNYKTLAKNYQNDINYFDSKVTTLVKNYLYEKQLESAGGEEVANITGIKRVDDRSISIQVLGNSTSAMKTLFDVPILPLSYYGNLSQYDYENDQFGFTRGDLTSVKTKSAEPVGTGLYKYSGFENGIVGLLPNEFYFGEQAASPVALRYVPEEQLVDSLLAGDIDMIQKTISAEEEEQIAGVNDNGELSGNAIGAVKFNDSSYLYFGINAKRVHLGDSTNSEASVHLRRALAILLAAKRDSACETYFGERAQVVEYPYSTTFWGMITEADEMYQQAFSTLSDGTAIEPGKELEAAKKELELAGYTFDAETGKVAKSPEDGGTVFHVLVPPYLAGENAMTDILSRTAQDLYSIGFELAITEFTSLDEFVLTLTDGNMDIWCAQRSTDGEPQLTAFYKSGGSNNFYRVTSDTLDELIAACESASGREAKTAAYKNVFKRIMELAIEVPAYQKQSVVLFNAARITYAETQNPTEFFGFMKDLAHVYRGAAPAETEPAETAPEQSTPESVTETDSSSETESTSGESSSEESASETGESESTEPETDAEGNTQVSDPDEDTDTSKGETTPAGEAEGTD